MMACTENGLFRESLSTLEKVSEKTNERRQARIGPAKGGKWKIVRRNNYV